MPIQSTMRVLIKYDRPPIGNNEMRCGCVLWTAWIPADFLDKFQIESNPYHSVALIDIRRVKNTINTENKIKIPNGISYLLTPKTKILFYRVWNKIKIERIVVCLLSTVHASSPARFESAERPGPDYYCGRRNKSRSHYFIRYTHLTCRKQAMFCE